MIDRVIKTSIQTKEEKEMILDESLIEYISVHNGYLSINQVLEFLKKVTAFIQVFLFIN